MPTDDEELRYERRGRARLRAFMRAFDKLNRSAEGTPQALEAARKVRDVGLKYTILTPDAGFWFVVTAAEPIAARCLAIGVDPLSTLALVERKDEAKRRGNLRQAHRLDAQCFRLLAPFLIAVLDAHGESDAALTVAAGYHIYERRRRAGKRDFDKLTKSGRASVKVN